MKKRKLSIPVIIIIIILMMSTVGAVYAYWDSLKKEADVTLEVGEGVELILSAADYSEGKLVPSTALIKEGDVTYIAITITASLSEPVVTPANLSVEANFVEDFGDLFTITVDAPETITDSAEVTITIEFAREPDNQEEYDTVANQSLDMKVVFTVAG